jgi:hypothetical protein
MAPSINKSDVDEYNEPADHVRSSETAKLAPDGTKPHGKVKLTSAFVMSLERKYGAHK